MLRKELLNQVANEFHLKPSEVELLYNLWWKEVKTSIESNDLTKYQSCKFTDINIPNIGKLVLDVTRANKINERINFKRHSATEQSDSDNG